MPKTGGKESVMKSTSIMFKGMLTILLGLTVIVFSSETFAQGTWTTKAPMPTARIGPAGGVIDNRLYVVGGSVGGSTNVNQIYDPRDR